jgi:hypothetical protein
MAKYYITFSCGHTGTIDLVGKGSERERKLSWYQSGGVCSECFKAQREADKIVKEQQKQEENGSAAANAEAMGLSALTGTEKQIAWATTIRQNFVDKVLMSKPTVKGMKIFNYIIDNAIKASEWIDTRDETAVMRLRRYEALMSDAPVTIDEEQLASESVAQPETVKHPGAVVITVKPASVAAAYSRGDEFRTIVKSLGYKWDGDTRCWFRDITARTGLPADRAAELGNKLLLAGFTVQITDDDIRNMAVNGTYNPERKRWITLYTGGDYKGWLCIGWEKDNEDIYKKARLLPGSRWSSPNMAVPVSDYQAVCDFADLFGFKISDKARGAMEDYHDSVTIVAPKAAADVAHPDKLAEILESSADIIDDLRDD